MEPLYSSNTEFPLWLLVASVFFSVAIMLFAASSWDGTNKRKVVLTVIAAGAVFFLASLIGIVVSTSAAAADRDTTVKDRIKLIETTYGISVNDDVYRNLNYPRNAPEEGTFSSYGSVPILTKQSGKVEQTEIALVWNETEFQLVNISNGPTEAEELPRLEESK